MSDITRREFMQRSAIAGAGMTLAAGSVKNVLGANDTVNVAVVGINSKGYAHIQDFGKLENVRIAAICDPDQNLLDKNVAELAEKGVTTKAYRDYRDVLDDKNIDAVIIATPNHWHSLMAIWGCQAKKHVYVEKPVSHNIWEGRKIVEAQKKYKRIVQTGTQNRSDPGLKEAFEYIQQGNLGKIKVARGFCYKPRKSIGKVNGPQPIPSYIDWDLWTGPAPLKPLMREQLHYDWHWQWDTGCGDIGNQGIHEMDLCRWAIGAEDFPTRVMSIGGRFGYDDDGQTANTQIALLDYEPAPIIFKVRGLPDRRDVDAMSNYKGVRIGVVIECENGYFAGGGGGGWVYDNDGKRIKQFKGDGGAGHHANFISAVRNNDYQEINAPILGGHISSGLCHLGNISYRLGHKVPQAEIKNAIKSNSMMMETLGRFEDHLFKNWIDLSKDMAAMGPMLEFDGKKEKFISNTKFDAGFWANTMLKRDYREPFVVPEKV